MTQRRDGPRPTVIGTCTLSRSGIRDGEECLANGLAMVDAMAKKARQNGWGLDIVLLPESFAHGEGSVTRTVAETLDGRIVKACAAKACEYHTYAAISMFLREGDGIHNAVVLIDRQGQPVGTYHKGFPVVRTDGTLEGGVTPGRDFPVFDLDFGRVGVQVCFDACYEEGWKSLAEQEAELVLHPSASPGVAALVSHAWRFGYYIVGSIHRPPSVMIDPLGHEIARSAKNREVAVVQVDLDYRILPSRFIWTRGQELRNTYAGRVDYGWHDAEGACLLTSLDPSLPAGRFVHDEGLETMRDFLERNREAQIAARGGPPAPAGRARNRPCRPV
ncbi:MAG: carbon-nitrogen hydrolase family protein [Kiritimatiellae bacterium]|nr:carbon-nitrogen hydrolase family protein [Kiritimatiellia bacterium]